MRYRAGPQRRARAVTRAGRRAPLYAGHEQHRRHQRLHGLAHRHRAELALRDAALDHAGDHPLGRLHHLLAVELADVGKIAHLGQHQLADARGARLADAPPPLVDQLRQQLAHRPVEAAHEVLAVGDLARDVLADHRLQQLLLARVVEVERALGGAGARRHLLGARGGEALLDEQLEGRVEQLLRAGLLAALTRRRRVGQSGRAAHAQLLTDGSVM